MRSPRHYYIEFLPLARRDLGAIRGPRQNRLREAIRLLADDPHPADSLPLTGRGAGLYRLRVADYRVVYRVHEERVIVLIVRVGPRSDVYRGLEPPAGP